MANGFTTEQMLEMIWDDVKEIKRQVEHVNANGCAQRENDTARIASLERWRTRGIIGVIGLLVGMVLSFFGFHK